MVDWVKLSLPRARWYILKSLILPEKPSPILKEESEKSSLLDRVPSWISWNPQYIWYVTSLSLATREIAIVSQLPPAVKASSL